MKVVHHSNAQKEKGDAHKKLCMISGKIKGLL